MAYIQKIITANNIVNGSAVTHKTRKGDIQSVNPEITRNSLDFNLALSTLTDPLLPTVIFPKPIEDNELAKPPFTCEELSSAPTI